MYAGDSQRFLSRWLLLARQLHETIDVPIGMVNNAWGGSACEAWINRDVLNADPQYASMMERWVSMEKQFADLSAKSDLNEDERKRSRI